MRVVDSPVVITGLRQRYRDSVADFHLEQGDWDCGCDDNLADDQFCQESQAHAWAQLTDWFQQAITVPAARPTLAMAA